LFDLPGVNQSNAKFDGKKLSNMNMTYLLELPADRFVARALQYFAAEKNTAVTSAPAGYFREVMLLSQPKIKSIDELGAYTVYFFTDDFPVDPKVKEKVMGKGDPKARLAELIAWWPTADVSSDTAIEDGIKALAAKGGLGFGDYQAVARLALSGTNVGPSITGMMRVLGRERVRARFEKFLASA
jgi:nondiscriminating glutamyl-tRNA synthetase